MLTLYWIVKQSVAETVVNKASVNTRNSTLGTISGREQDYVAPFQQMQYLQHSTTELLFLFTL